MGIIEIISIIWKFMFEGMKSYTTYKDEQIDNLKQSINDKEKENDLLKKDIEIENEGDITNRNDLYNGLS